MAVLRDQSSLAVVVKAGAGRFGEITKLGGVSPNDIKVSSQDTREAFSVFEYTGIGKGGPPLHIHPYQDEVFYILQGEYLYQCGEERFSLKNGDPIFLPRGVAHTWAQLTEEVKLLFFFQPAGKMEAFFRAVGNPESVPISDGGPDLFELHDMKIVGPPIDFESAR